MIAIPIISKTIPLQDYTLLVEFADGVAGEINLSKWVGKGLFTEWNNKQNFDRVTITKDGKLHWTDDIEMDPDAFYLQLINKTFDEYAGHQPLLRHTY